MYRTAAFICTVALCATSASALTIVQPLTVAESNVAPTNAVVTSDGSPTGVVNVDRSTQPNTSTYSINSFDTTLGTLLSVDLSLEITAMNSFVYPDFAGCSLAAPCDQELFADLDYIFGLEFAGYPFPGVSAGEAGAPIEPDFSLQSSVTATLFSNSVPGSVPSGLSAGDRLDVSTSAQTVLDYFSQGSTVNFDAVAAAELTSVLTCRDAVTAALVACSDTVNFFWDWEADVTVTYTYREPNGGGGIGGPDSGSGDGNRVPPVPLPAGLPLLLVALGGLAVLRRRSV